MMNPRRNSEAAQRAAARRLREDEAPRLMTEVPTLDSLRLEVEERREHGTVSSSHIRRVVIDNAPALFVVGCNDRACKEGGHDVTSEVMRALRAKKTEFDGSHPCEGNVGSARCASVMHYKAFATYK
jgi:hypothetical protein